MFSKARNLHLIIAGSNITDFELLTFLNLWSVRSISLLKFTDISQWSDRAIALGSISGAAEGDEHFEDHGEALFPRASSGEAGGDGFFG